MIFMLKMHCEITVAIAYLTFAKKRMLALDGGLQGSRFYRTRLPFIILPRACRVELNWKV